MIKQQGGLSKAMMIRLHPGEDLIQGITAACVAQGMQGGAVESCIGSLQSASFFTVVPLGNKIDAGYGDPIELKGRWNLCRRRGLSAWTWKAIC